MNAILKIGGKYWECLDFRKPEEGEYYFNSHGDVVKSQGRTIYPYHIVKSFAPERYYVNETTLYDREDMYFCAAFSYYEDALKVAEKLNNGLDK